MDLVPAGRDRLEENARDEPVAGTYWRARGDVALKMRQVPYQEHALRGETEPRIAYRSEVERAALKAGTLLLLRTTHVIEGRVHSVVTSPDPSDPDDPSRDWLVDEFLEAMEPVDAAEADQIRNAQAGETLAKIASLRDEMSQIASAASAESKGRRLIAPPASEGPKALVKVQREAAEEKARALATRAEQIGAVNVRMQDEVKALGRLQGERASAALASVQDALKLAKKASEAVASLDLFGGDAVEVTKVLDGEGAPDGTPVKIYQNRLFLDEEVAVHLHVGGFDHRKLADLGDYLSEIPGLLDRIIPGQRGVVLVRIRRNNKVIDGSDFGTIMAQIEDAKADRTQFLLMRDGQRVHLTFAETALQEAERLFPTKDEMDKPFRGSGAESIGYQDVRYVEALNAFERQALVYKRLLILLWGLEFSQERPLGRIDLAREAGEWTSQAWQAEHLEFISDDATLSLPKAGTTVREWLAENRSQITHGSRIAIDWEEAIDADSAPTCAKHDYSSRSERDIFTRKPVERYGIAIVKMEGAVPTAMAEVRHVTTRVRSRAKVRLEGRESSFIVLDTVDEAELDSYAESRISRRDYLSYLALFQVAKAALRGEMDEIAAINAKIASDLQEAYRDRPEAEVAKAVKRAHILLRAQQAGKPAEPRQQRAIAETASMILTGRPDAAELARIAGVPQKEVLRSAIDGNGRARIIAPGPFEPLSPDMAWVTAITAERTKSGGWDAPRSEVATLDRAMDPSLHVAYASPELARIQKASKLPVGLEDLSKTRSLTAALMAATPESIAAWHAPASDPRAAVLEWIDMTREMTFGRNRPEGAPERGVLMPARTTVIAAIARKVPDRYDHGVAVLVAESDPLVDALIADPSLDYVMRRAFANIWLKGGDWKIDEVKNAAKAIMASGGRPLDRRRILIMSEDSTRMTTKGAIRSGNPHAYGYSDVRFCVNRANMDKYDRARAWDNIACVAGMAQTDDPYGRTSDLFRNDRFRVVANRATFQWMIDEHDLGAPLLGDVEYHWLDS